jgi:hypothetical protein
MILTLSRIALKETYTIGKLYIDGCFFCDTLEDKYRDLSKEEKVSGKTAIPYGRYKVILSMSNRFKKIMPLLLEVPKFEGIRIHSGNTDQDTEGCILVGENTVEGKVINSRNTFNRLMILLNSAIERKEQIQIHII